MRGSGFGYPVTLAEWSQVFMKAIRQLETPSGLKLLPKNREKTRTLFMLGESKPRNSVQQAPVWQDLDKTWQVLLHVQQAGDVQPLLRYCKANPASSAVDKEVTESHRQMSGGQRDQSSNKGYGLGTAPTQYQCILRVLSRAI